MISARQRELLSEWLPGAEVVRDLSWGLVGTTVIEVAHRGARYVAKAGGEQDHHLARELRAHGLWLDPWTAEGRAPVLVAGDEQAKLLLLRYLEGELVEGSQYEKEPGTYRQAGELLAAFHAQGPS